MKTIDKEKYKFPLLFKRAWLFLKIVGVLGVLTLGGCATNPKFYNLHMTDPDAIERQLVIDRGYCLQVAAGSVPIPQVRHYQTGVTNYSIAGAARYSDGRTASSGVYQGTVTQYPSAGAAFSSGFASGINMGSALRAIRERNEVLKGCMYRLGWTDNKPAPLEQEFDKNNGGIWKQYKEQAKNGDMNAAYLVGLAYLYGEDVQQNTTEALFWLNVASDRQHADSSLALHYFYTGMHDEEFKDLKQANQYLERALENGSIFAKVVKADYLRQGLLEHPHDIARALGLYNMACDADEDVACLRLGLMYGLGEGVPMDLRAGFNYLVKAHQLGNQDAEKYILWIGPYILEREKQDKNKEQLTHRAMEIIQLMIDAGYEVSEDYLSE